jgi:hypothetical protein
MIGANVLDSHVWEQLVVCASNSPQDNYHVPCLYLSAAPLLRVLDDD